MRALVALLLLAGCDQFDRPNRPVPDTFQARTLSGEVIDRHALRGKPWVLALWVPW